MKIWKSIDHDPEQALDLPTGRLAANFGILIEQSVKPENVLEAAAALIENKIEVTAASQAHVMVLAQKNKVAFTDWAAEIKTF